MIGSLPIETNAAFSAAGAMAVVFLIWQAFLQDKPFEARLKSVGHRRDELQRAMRHQKKSRHEKKNTSQAWLKKLITNLKLVGGKSADGLRLKLARAGYRSRDAMLNYIAARFVAGGGVACLVFFYVFVLHVVHVPPTLGAILPIVGGFVGFLLPDLYLKNQAQKRQQLLRKAMPDALDLLVICAEAGLSLDAALQRVSREMATGFPELAEEIGLTAIELGFYPERARALQNLADRAPLPGIVALTSTLTQTEKYGTPLAQALRVLSAEMREERIMAAEAKAAKLPATLTVPMILFILPPLFVVLIGPAALKVSGFMNGH